MTKLCFESHDLKESALLGKKERDEFEMYRFSQFW